MTEQDGPDISEPPDVATLEYRDVLAAYGQAMVYVQGFEHTLKSFPGPVSDVILLYATGSRNGRCQR